MTPHAAEQRAFALIGAALADDLPALDALTSDLDLTECRWIIRAFAIRLAADFRSFCPDPDIAHDLITQATIRAALKEDA